MLKIAFLAVALCAFNAQADSSAAKNNRFQNIEDLKTYSLGRFTIGGNIKPSLGHFVGFVDIEKHMSVMAGISPVFIEPRVKAEMQLLKGVDLSGSALGCGFLLSLSSKVIVVAGITYLLAYVGYKVFQSKKSVKLDTDINRAYRYHTEDPDTGITLETQSN